MEQLFAPSARKVNEDVVYDVDSRMIIIDMNEMIDTYIDNDLDFIIEIP